MKKFIITLIFILSALLYNSQELRRGIYSQPGSKGLIESTGANKFTIANGQVLDSVSTFDWIIK
jgi:hypothetical protein